MYRQFTTDQPMELVLSEFLKARQGASGVASRRTRTRGGQA